MTIELLNKLGKKVAHAVETIELLRLQIDELEEENAALKAEQEKWRNDLSKLLTRFEPLDTASSVSEDIALDLYLEEEELA